MTDTDHLIDRLIDKFERNYNIRLTPIARDCLTRDFKIEIQKLIDDAYATGWHNSQDSYTAGWSDSRDAFDDEAGTPTP